MQGQGHRPTSPTITRAQVVEEQRGPRLDGVFKPNDRVRVKGKTARLYHVQRLDTDRDDSIRITPDCGCGGGEWITPDRLLHDTYG